MVVLDFSIVNVALAAVDARVPPGLQVERALPPALLRDLSADEGGPPNTARRARAATIACASSRAPERAPLARRHAARQRPRPGAARRRTSRVVRAGRRRGTWRRPARLR